MRTASAPRRVLLRTRHVHADDGAVAPTKIVPQRGGDVARGHFFLDIRVMRGTTSRVCMIHSSRHIALHPDRSPKFPFLEPQSPEMRPPDDSTPPVRCLRPSPPPPR
jgi:hypothetical protein